MTSTGTITSQVRQHIRSQQAWVEQRTAADVVSDALLSSSINVREISLEQWKAIIFDAFQAVREPAWISGC